MQPTDHNQVKVAAEADRELLARLQQDNFQGPVWEHFAAILVSYGYGAISKRIKSGEIFVECFKRKIKGLPSGDRPPIPSRDIADLTELTVAEAICAFREVLRRGRWSAEGGASLTTFFLGQCFIRFPGCYRRWLREARPAGWVALGSDDGTAIDLQDPRDGVLDATQLIDLDRHLASLDDRTRQVIIRRVQGYSEREIGIELGITTKAVEALLYRYRGRLGHAGGLQ